MKPWFIREGDVIKFPDPSEKKIVRLPTIDQYPSFIDGVMDLQAQLDDGRISRKIYDKLYTDLIHRWAKKESMEPWFIKEAMGGMWDRYLEKKGGKEIKFQSVGTKKIYNLIDVAVFPQDEKKLSYKDDINKNSTNIDMMQNDIESFLTSKGNPNTQVINTRSPRLNAAMIVIVGQNQTPEFAFIKYFEKKRPTRPPIFWKTSHFQNDTGLVQVGDVKSATAKTAELKIEPSDLLSAQTKYKVDEIPKIIETNLKARQNISEELKVGLPAMLNNLIKQPKTPVPGIDSYKDTIAVAFGEIVSPIALAKNLSTRGSYDKAQKELLTPLGVKWSDFQEVQYGARQTKLADSYLFAGNVKLVVSSKARQGSPASITTAMETLERFPKDFGPAFQKKYKSFLPVLKTLHENDAIIGVLNSAQIKNIITEEERNYIINIYGKGLKNANLKNYPNLPRIDLNRPRVDRKNPKFDIGYHLLGGVAKELKLNLNQNLPLITDFFKAVLNKSAMVQVYTRIDGNEKGIWFSAFDVIWPPVFEGNIIIESDFYTSNARPAKKFSFQFN